MNEFQVHRRSAVRAAASRVASIVLMRLERVLSRVACPPDARPAPGDRVRPRADRSGLCPLMASPERGASTLLTLQRVVSGSVVQNVAGVFTDDGTPVPRYIRTQLLLLLALGHLTASAVRKEGTAIRMTAIGARLLTRLEDAWEHIAGPDEDDALKPSPR